MIFEERAKNVSKLIFISTMSQLKLFKVIFIWKHLFLQRVTLHWHFSHRLLNANIHPPLI